MTQQNKTMNFLIHDANGKSHNSNRQHNRHAHRYSINRFSRRTIKYINTPFYAATDTCSTSNSPDLSLPLTSFSPPVAKGSPHHFLSIEHASKRAPSDLATQKNMITVLKRFFQFLNSILQSYDHFFNAFDHPEI